MLGGGLVAYAGPPEKMLEIWCSLVRFGVYLMRLCLEKFLKINIFLFKK